MNQNANQNPAETYESFFGPAIFTPWADVLLEYAQPRPGERVLDLACGTGIVTRKAASKVGEQGQVLGLDISPGMLTVARSLPSPDGIPIEWQEGSATAVPLPDAAYDLVLCQQGLQFFPDRPAAVREMRRVLAPGAGRAAVAVWQGLDQHPVFAAVMQAEARHLKLPLEALATPFSFGDAEELRRLFQEAGFREVDIEARTLDVHFASPDRFVELTALAGAAVLPELEMGPEERAALVEAIRSEADPIVQRHRNGDRLSFPMTTHVVVAQAGA